MIKKIKDKLYFLKVWHRRIFLYPQEKIRPESSLNYDEYWKKKLKNRTTCLSRHEKSRAEIVLSHIQPEDEIIVADIAGGPGVILEYIMKRNSYIRGVSYDISDYALGLAREKGVETSKFDINDQEELGALKESDYFLLLEILEHLPHSEKVLHAAYNKARKGVFFSFPNTGFFIHRLRLLFGKAPAQWVSFPNEHLRFWTNTDLKWWLNALGYTDYKIIYYQGIPFLRKIWPSLFAGSFVVFLKK